MKPLPSFIRSDRDYLVGQFGSSLIFDMHNGVAQYTVVENGRIVSGNTPGGDNRLLFTISSDYRMHGKFYAEARVDALLGSGGGTGFGITIPHRIFNSGYSPYTDALFDDNVAFAYTGDRGIYYQTVGGVGAIKRGDPTTLSAAAAFTVGDVISVAIDCNLTKVWFAKNGVWDGDPETGTGGYSYDYVAASGASTNLKNLGTVYLFFHLRHGNQWTARLLASEFTQPVPTGFRAWDLSDTEVPIAVPQGSGVSLRPQYVQQVFFHLNPTAPPLIPGSVLGPDDLRGDGSIEGVVRVNNVPSARLVCLFDRSTKKILASKVSNPDGTFRFEKLNHDREYFLSAFDHLREYNAVIQDMIRSGP